MHVFLVTRLKILLFMTHLSVTKACNNEALKSIRVGKIKINQRPSNKQKAVNCKVLGSKVPATAGCRVTSRHSSEMDQDDAHGCHPFPAEQCGAGHTAEPQEMPRSPAIHALLHAGSSSQPLCQLQDTDLSEESSASKTDFGHQPYNIFQSVHPKIVPACLESERVTLKLQSHKHQEIYCRNIGH